ncbi:MAG: DUF2569 domain-containing protein [Colwellia sp.]|nr:DUF2569 domain-containing protein [Colwellia sp.]
MEVSKSREPLKLGGWLILVALGVVLSPLRLLHLSGTTFPPIFTDGTWEALTTQGSEAYSPIWGPFLIGEILINLIMVLLGIYLVYLFFTKKATLPKWYFGLALFSTVFIVIDAYIVTLVVPDMEVFNSETMKELGHSLVRLLIWSPYLLFSQRSKDTFLNVRK